MAIIIPEGDQDSAAGLLDAAEYVFRAAETALLSRIEDIKADEVSDDLKRELLRYRDTLQLVVKERQNVEERKRKQSGAGAGGYALDLGDARAEIGRRLACLSKR